ncbi:fungal hydrophobin-domain-containing protein [Crucibulum laeve]|uniref:Hydrophobin n=1 Tax=Crucibulum laeve TaxID=68775 RepID=A0A5C3MGJ8_9AGAR|nr:fungal hydrophobin-domain-containing protein [Crucibulum laeve]
MQLKPLAIVTAITAITSLAAATPTRRTLPASHCTTGPIQCCNSIQSANSAAASNILALLGIVVQDVTALVGLTCDPITVIGAGGNSCSAQSVCCENNSFDGVVALGCTPVDLSL